MKVRARAKNGVLDVKSIITHPMETGLRKDKTTGETIPAHYIQEVVAEIGGERVMTAYWSGAVSKNPFIRFQVKLLPGPFKLTWTDNTGATGYALLNPDPARPGRYLDALCG
jgi:sulfur-oxidizing protein SoxZ